MSGGKFTTLYAIVILGVGFALAIGLMKEEGEQPAPARKSDAVYYASGQAVVIQRAADGHFWLEADVNGTPVRFLVDTGASHIILTEEDADRIGFNLTKQDYSLSFSTANGEAAAAPVRLDEVEVGDIAVRNVAAAVNSAAMPQSLLGMSFLERLSGFEVSGDRLILKP